MYAVQLNGCEHFRDIFLPFKVAVPRVITEENQHECLAQVVTPLWNLPYGEQLALKQKWAAHVLNVLRKNLEKEGIKHGIYVKNTLQKIESSPVTEKYRNKDEFCVYTGVDGNPKTVGFFIGSKAKGSVVCVRSDELVNMRDSHKMVAKVFEEYIRASPHRTCLEFEDGGHWRNLLVRSNLKGDLMATVVFHPQSMSPEELNQEAKSLANFFEEGGGKECNLSSLYFQACPHTRCTHDQAPFQLLLRQPFLNEQCLGHTFRLSPDSFFQVNTLAAELLYEVVITLANPSYMTTLLDVCCGTGTLAVLASPRVRGVVGIESVYSAVRDARANTAANNCSNVEVVPGLAEKKLPRVISELEYASDIVAVVNPGRGGVGPQVIKALRECKQIERVVYVSCNAEGHAMRNFAQLCAPCEGKGKKWPKEGLPFSLKKVVPVDLFPHTVHCEMVLLFERKL
ncbi:tRNA (uracil(54)-C(5))-methyltransferase homolog-B-like isoform X2 [Ischnura elegans]|uniref:tRNA (uracil(54)-C(5))-methyltransferase homolog-B-like isoform X2 n=1 Tax=Ischnura elegans TaxID=197161 RepID=UPI001ED88908|nr:tRNA (uracil(54)-C(5))-methyltransferase homolog-B-like isoform X2 [Ischnura elegans]